MNVIAVENYSNGVTRFAVVRLDSEELCRLLFADPSSLPKLKAGDEVSICSRFDHCVKVEGAIKSAKDMPSKLRTLADLLEMNHPALLGITEEKLEFGV